MAATAGLLGAGPALLLGAVLASNPHHAPVTVAVAVGALATVVGLALVVVRAERVVRQCAREVAGVRAELRAIGTRLDTYADLPSVVRDLRGAAGEDRVELLARLASIDERLTSLAGRLDPVRPPADPSPGVPRQSR